jgi:hypothetical protein
VSRVHHTAWQFVERQAYCASSVWKPLVGPVQDWPLALCEASSLDAEQDLEPCDLVYPDYVVENRQVYHSSQLRWIYLSDQQDDEAWVFVQSDSHRKGWTGMYQLNRILRVSFADAEQLHTQHSLCLLMRSRRGHERVSKYVHWFCMTNDDNHAYDILIGIAISERY